jgi:hypothetical protein
MERRVRPLTATLLAYAVGLDLLISLVRNFSTNVTQLFYLFLFASLCSIFILGLVKGYKVTWYLIIIFSGSSLISAFLGVMPGLTISTMFSILFLILALLGPSRVFYLNEVILAEDELHTKKKVGKVGMVLRGISSIIIIYIVFTALTFLAVIGAFFRG